MSSLQEALPIIRSQFSSLKVCSPTSKVYKDECKTAYTIMTL